jgi:hypothetical protein
LAKERPAKDEGFGKADDGLDTASVFFKISKQKISKQKEINEQ